MMKIRSRFLLVFSFTLLFGLGLTLFEAPEAKAYNFDRVLKEGSSGADVQEVQIRVAGWAADSPSQTYVKIDGIFGPGTKAAVKRFQKAYGLTDDGIVGPATAQKLNELERSTGTKHFSYSEFYSKDGSGFSGGKVPEATVKENVRRLMYKLEALRVKVGNKPITINSGFRSIRHNGNVGGATNSMHLYGIAADISISGVSLSTVKSTAKTSGFSGIYNGSSFTHVDSRVEYPYGSQSWWWN
ncbi:peptidoglycan-binding protein [Bacillus aquiflavi]|uniref:DUF882 domain-containing protein n=1 Tax=Bacillus aquiflavi TaxID=2672567 RepID=A0A6B3W3L5_9BACI|nr:D-Ala-D-Ala carboxypeptidase family metallohydrolase [Bacillus aquiflavi]MBA4538186.1 peptidoglycan-binding protein [Bacillus aquiflavi]NEY82506.1 DUF882 domain-containing protein [Bacillus aquiflavi]UAC48088.1 peptidoglycan-binding protein [Bacillus aquiflavi]